MPRKRFYDNRRALKVIRRDLREHATPAERRLWTLLRGRRLGGAKWRRQYSVGPYVLDFYCPAAQLAVELDGAVHADPLRARHDQERTASLGDRGIRVVRFDNAMVMRQPDLVGEALRELMEQGAGPLREGQTEG